ncbi:hypothetical protein HYN59_01465 [Flavobacterium album]|uniref:Integral membrane protein n=1 Tax=Flavobacterium album TaxID=2175091 RepID=A0A2S1QU06_9FLAO|nr:hypothetical protein [Flavobacterium album]AWH83864.1 hypothetical protein HYN59_01465 [Flavobacterium album]
MNLNLVAYSIFLAIVIYIIVVVGRICYRNGNLFVLELLPGHEDLCLRINKILLMGYYLVNIGYAAMTLVSWEKITGLPQLVEVIAIKTAGIICIISALHYLNIYLLTNHVQKLIR